MFLTFETYLFDGTQSWDYKVNILGLEIEFYNLNLIILFQYMRSLNNFRAEQPHQHAMYYLRLLMTEVAWTKDELKEALDGNILPVLYFILLKIIFNGKCLVTKLMKVLVLNCACCSSKAPAVPDLSRCWWMSMPPRLLPGF